MEKTPTRLFGAAAVALMTTACATTTTDPYECANQGIFSVTSGCPQDVANETARMKTEDLAQVENDTVSIKDRIGKLGEVESDLKARVTTLLAELKDQESDLAVLRKQLDVSRRNNKVSKAEYTRLINDLDDVNDRIEFFEGINSDNYSEKNASDLNDFLTTEVVEIKNRVREVSVG